MPESLDMEKFGQLFSAVRDFAEADVRALDLAIHEGVALTRRMADDVMAMETLGVRLGDLLRAHFDPNQMQMTLARPTGTLVLKRKVDAKVQKKGLKDRETQVAALGFKAVERRQETHLRADKLAALLETLGAKDFCALLNLKLSDTKVRKLEQQLHPHDLKVREFASTKQAGDPVPTTAALEALDDGEGYTKAQVTELTRIIARVEKPPTATFTPPATPA